MALSDLQRRDKVTNRRSESGLKEIKFYLNPETITFLKEFSSRIGYKGKVQNEDLSRIIESLIRQKIGNQEQLIGRKKTSQYLIFLHEVIIYQRQLGYSKKQMINFLSEHYPLPIFYKSTDNKWNITHLNKLMDHEWIKSKVQTLEKITRKNKKTLLNHRNNI
jgi:hypothetical protein